MITERLWSVETGLPLVASHLVDLVVVALLLLCCIAIGLRLLSMARLMTGRALEEIVLAAGIGIGVLGNGLLLLGAMGLYRAAGFVILLAPALVVLYLEAPGVAERIRTIGSALQVALRDQPWKWPALLIFLAVALLLLALASPPPVNWDSLMYHLEVPRRFLETGWIHVPEGNLHVFTTGLVNMLYGPLLLVGSPATASLLSASIALLLGVAVYAFSSRFLDVRTAVLSLVGLWGTTIILLTAATPRIDVTLTFLLFLAHYCLFLAFTLENRRFVHLAGLIGGFAFGAKFHAIAYLAGLFPIVLWMVYRDTGSYRRAMSSGALFGGIAFLAAAPWLVKNWVLLGAPLYPLFAEPILPPWMASLYGDDAVPASVPDAVFGYVRSLRQPFNLRDAFLAPGRLTMEFEGMIQFFSPILLLSPLWWLCKRRSKLTWLVVPAFVYLVFLLVPFPRTNLRYLLPAIPALTIVGFDSVVGISDRIRMRRIRAAALSLVAGIALLPSVISMGLWLPYTSPAGNLLGSVSGREFLGTHPLFDTAFEMISEVNERTGRDDRVLLLFEGRAFYFEADVLQDNLAWNWPLLAPLLERRPCLEGSGITHVVVSFTTLQYFIRAGGPDTDLLQWGTFRGFAENCLRYAWSNGAYVLYEVQPRPPAPHAPDES